MVKICGITREEDGLLAAELGADMLGFVFSTTKRLTTEEFVKSFSTKLRAEGNPVPLLVGVITDPESVEGKTAIKLATDEVLWIWQKKSNNINDLKSHIWDEWADPDGSIGKAYGYQLGVKHEYKEGMMDQVDRVLYDLKNNPYSRRIMTNIYVHQDLHEMNLYPCAYSMTFNVTKEKDSDKLVLNGILNQRQITGMYVSIPCFL